jgi:hypothetical protein
VTSFVIKGDNGVIVSNDEKRCGDYSILVVRSYLLSADILDELLSVTTTELLTRNILEAISCYYESWQTDTSGRVNMRRIGEEYQ